MLCVFSFVSRIGRRLSRKTPLYPARFTKFFSLVAMNELKPRFTRSVEQYLSDCKRKAFSLRTISLYAHTLKEFFTWLEAQYPGVASVTEISREMISSYQMFLYRRTSRFGKRLSNETQYRCLGTVIWFFRWMLENEKILINPAATIVLPKKERRIPRNYLSLKEMQRLLRAPNIKTHIGLRNRAMLEVFYSTAIRAGELASLKIEDLNLQDGWLTVRAGKGKKDRVVPLGKAAAHFVQLYLEKTRPKLDEEGKSSALFVTRYRGCKPLSYSSILDIVTETAKAAGIKRKVSPHALRHTCATLMLRGKADIRHIQEMLGHSSLSSTQVYTRVEIGDLKKVHAKCHPREREPIDKK